MRKLFTLFMVVLIGVVLSGCKNVLAEEDFNLINKGMSTEKVIEILGEPEEKTTDMSIIKKDVYKVHRTLANYFDLFDDDFVESLEDTSSNRLANKSYYRFKFLFEDIIIAKEFVDNRDNLEMYTYPYEKPRDEEYIYYRDILFHDDKVIYFWID